MNFKRVIFLILFIGSPYFCFASGNDIIPFLILEILLVASFVIFIFSIKMNKKAKIYLSLAFVISNLIAHLMISDLPYAKHSLLIKLFTIGVPILVVLICYFIHSKYCSASNS